MGNAEMAVMAVRLLNALMEAATQLRVNYKELADVMEEADSEGRDVTVEDLEGLQTDTQEALEDLQKAIREARERENGGE